MELGEDNRPVKITVRENLYCILQKKRETSLDFCQEIALNLNFFYALIYLLNTAKYAKLQSAAILNARRTQQTAKHEACQRKDIDYYFPEVFLLLG